MNFLNIAKTTAIMQLRQLQLSGPQREKHGGIIILGVSPSQVCSHILEEFDHSTSLERKKRPTSSCMTLFQPRENETPFTSKVVLTGLCLVHFLKGKKNLPPLITLKLETLLASGSLLDT